jgi:hypothetical protein
MADEETPTHRTFRRIAAGLQPEGPTDLARRISAFAAAVAVHAFAHFAADERAGGGTANGAQGAAAAKYVAGGAPHNGAAQGAHLFSGGLMTTGGNAQQADGGEGIQGFFTHGRSPVSTRWTRVGRFLLLVQLPALGEFLLTDTGITIDVHGPEGQVVLTDLDQFFQ